MSASNLPPLHVLLLRSSSQSVNQIKEISTQISSKLHAGHELNDFIGVRDVGSDRADEHMENADLLANILTEKLDDFCSASLHHSTPTTFGAQQQNILDQLHWLATFATAMNTLDSGPDRIRLSYHSEKNGTKFADTIFLGVMSRAMTLTSRLVENIVVDAADNASESDSDDTRIAADICKVGTHRLQVIFLNLWEVVMSCESHGIEMNLLTPAICQMIVDSYEECLRLDHALAKFFSLIDHETTSSSFSNPAIQNTDIKQVIGILAGILRRMAFLDEAEPLLSSDRILNQMLLPLVARVEDHRIFCRIPGAIRNIGYGIEGQRILTHARTADVLLDAMCRAPPLSEVGLWLNGVVGAVGNICNRNPPAQRLFFYHPNFFAAYKNAWELYGTGRLANRNAESDIADNLVTIEASFAAVLLGARTEEEAWAVMRRRGVKNKKEEKSASEKAKAKSDALLPFHVLRSSRTGVSEIVKYVESTVKQFPRAIELFGNKYFIASLKNALSSYPDVAEAAKGILEQLKKESDQNL